MEARLGGRLVRHRPPWSSEGTSSTPWHWPERHKRTSTPTASTASQCSSRSTVADWRTIAATKLARAEWLAMFTAGDLLVAGLELWDTGQSPHYDVVHSELAELVTRLVGCPHRLVPNDHYEPPEGGPTQ